MSKSDLRCDVLNELADVVLDRISEEEPGSDKRGELARIAIELQELAAREGDGEDDDDDGAEDEADDEDGIAMREPRRANGDDDDDEGDDEEEAA